MLFPIKSVLAPLHLQIITSYLPYRSIKGFHRWNTESVNVTTTLRCWQTLAYLRTSWHRTDLKIFKFHFVVSFQTVGWFFLKIYCNTWINSLRPIANMKYNMQTILVILKIYVRPVLQAALVTQAQHFTVASDQIVE